LGEAVDNTDLLWTTGGDADWFGENGCKCGSISTKIVADCYNAVAESNESNNEQFGKNRITYYIPDLIIQDISWDKSSPKPGDTITFTVKIKNQESGPAKSFYVYYYIDDSYVDYDYVSSLSAGAISTQSFTWTANKCGNVRVKAAADATNAVNEGSLNRFRILENLPTI